MLAKFSCASNRLPASLARFSQVAEPNNHCTLCNTDVVCDEFHCLFICNFFANDRSKLLEKKFICRPNTIKMEELFRSENPTVLLKLSKFCKIIMNKFK